MELLEHMCKFQMGNAFNHTVRNSILRQISLWEKEGSRLFLPRGNSILRQTFLWEKKGGRFSYGEKKGSRLLFIQARMRPKKDNFKIRYVFTVFQLSWTWFSVKCQREKMQISIRNTNLSDETRKHTNKLSSLISN